MAQVVEEGSVNISVHQQVCTVHYTLRWANKGDPSKVFNLLLLHGHSSSRKEFDDLYPYLTEANVFTFDQPNCGESSNVDRDAVFNAYVALNSDPESKYPGLFYLQDVCLLFVAKLLMPKLPPKSIRVVGGSLGGNLGLMLIERAPALPWLRDAVIWSPGSAWVGDVFQAVGALPALQRAGADWTGDAQRIAFFDGSWSQPVVNILGLPVTNPPPRPQAWYWYWDGWGGTALDSQPDLSTNAPDPANDLTLSNANYPLMTARKATAIRDAYRNAYQAFAADQGEAIWNARGTNRAKWHWQIASDELAFSHRQQLANGQRRIATATCDVLLMAGEHDNNDPSNLFGYTKQMHADLVASGSPVWSDFRPVADSGHSIHNEQPQLLSQILLAPLHA